MIQVNPDIFKLYDIRGVYGKDFDDEFAHEFGRKISAHFGDTVVVGRDDRQSSDVLQQAVVRGIVEYGGNVISIGECSTPLFYFSVNAAKANVGIMVTASHNPGEYNGFKVMKAGGNVIGGVELHRIFSLDYLAERSYGRLQEKSFADDYARRIISIADIGNFSATVGIAAPLAVQNILNIIERKTGLAFLYGQTAALTVTFDPDGDRISFTENGKSIPADFIFLLLVRELGFKSVVYGLSFSRIVRESLRAMGVRAVRSKVGRLFLHENMRLNDADFGGESSGHFYIKSFNYAEAPTLILLNVLGIMHKTGRSLSELVAPYQKYFKSPEISLPINRSAFDSLQEKYPDGLVNKSDGLTIDYPDWWLNLRLSNTEPVMRLVVEANTRELLDQRVREIKNIILVKQ